MPVDEIKAQNVDMTYPRSKAEVVWCSQTEKPLCLIQTPGMKADRPTPANHSASSPEPLLWAVFLAGMRWVCLSSGSPRTARPGHHSSQVIWEPAGYWEVLGMLFCRNKLISGGRDGCELSAGTLGGDRRHLCHRSWHSYCG